MQIVAFKWSEINNFVLPPFALRFNALRVWLSPDVLHAFSILFSGDLCSCSTEKNGRNVVLLHNEISNNLVLLTFSVSLESFHVHFQLYMYCSLCRKNRWYSCMIHDICLSCARRYLMKQAMKLLNLIFNLQLVVGR